MQLKWLEDLIALAEAGTMVRAAQMRHVTHPAFGRRIRALETWAGTPLIDRDAPSLRWTAAGEVVLEMARATVDSLSATRTGLLRQGNDRALHIATGRTLARTLLATWLTRMTPLTEHQNIRVTTDSYQKVATLLEAHEVDFILTYFHPALALRLDARRFTHLRLSEETLVPMSACHPDGRPKHVLSKRRPCAWIVYAQGLALSRLVEDHLNSHPKPPHLLPMFEVDSADVAHEFVLRGLGVAWLPRSMTVTDCRLGRMVQAGERGDEIRVGVRLYRPRKRLSELAETLWAATEPSP